MPNAKEGVFPLHHPFDVGFRGFRRLQVLSHIESLESDLRLLNADRDNVWKQAAALRDLADDLRADLAASRREVERLETAPASASALSARMRRTLALAEDEAAELRRRAQAEADTVRHDAEADAVRVRELAEREADRVRTDTDALVRRTAELCERMEDESRARREHAEREQQSAAQAHHRQALAEVAEREALFRARAAVLARVVGRQAREHIARAQLEMAELARLQDEVGRQLRSAQSVLGRAAGHLTVPDQRTAQPVVEHSVERPALTA